MSAITENLATVRARIAAACRAAGRAEDSVCLVAVTKGKPAGDIREAYAAGQRAFGESYAQELAEKAGALTDCPAIAWHFIGHLQSNKARLVAPVASFVHSVDSATLARELARRVTKAGRPPPAVLVEVNVAREPQKHGVAPEDLEEVLTAITAEPALTLRGLMTIPPADDLAAARRAFDTLVTLRSVNGGSARLPELSMGMTHDYELAIACGATLVRVGTAIFGPRA